MRRKLHEVIETLQNKMDHATNRLDALSQKLSHGLDTISDHLDERLNAHEEMMLKKLEKLDDKTPEDDRASESPQ